MQSYILNIAGDQHRTPEPISKLSQKGDPRTSEHKVRQIISILDQLANDEQQNRWASVGLKMTPLQNVPMHMGPGHQLVSAASLNVEFV